MKALGITGRWFEAAVVGSALGGALNLPWYGCMAITLVAFRIIQIARKS